MKTTSIHRGEGGKRGGVHWLAAVAGVGFGVALWLSPVGRWAERVSYDWAVLFQSGEEVADLVMVYVDEDTLAELGAVGGVLDRRWYARALERMDELGVERVVMDVLFLEPAADEGADEELARAIGAFGGEVVLAGAVQEMAEEGVAGMMLRAPLAEFRRAGAKWGIAGMLPDGDGVVRWFPREIEGRPSLAAAAAGGDGGVAGEGGVAGLRYHGPPGSVRGYGLERVLEEDGVADEVLEGTTVFVGGRLAAGSDPSAARDVFGTPYSKWGGEAGASGVDLHAEAYLSLRRGEPVRRVAGWVEALVVMVAGGLLGLVAGYWSPLRVMVVGAGLALVVALVGVLMQGQGGWWVNWFFPAGVQIPLTALGGSGVSYYVASGERRRLKKAFASYLSPEMAEEISHQHFDMKLGGKEVEATILFSDLEGFTQLAEELSPSEVSELLVEYFNRATRAILEEGGTVIKYVGDAVMASWGAPLEDEAHAERALKAALGLQRDTMESVAGRRLRTRVGINSGPVLAGNLGSEFRFDYTCIGYTTNVASRLEGLNRVLGTRVLIGEGTRKRLSERVVLREVGDFQLVGTRIGVRVFEPLEAGGDWVEVFEEGLEVWRRGDDGGAVELFQRVLGMRKGGDGVSAYFLKQIEAGNGEVVGSRRVLKVREK